MVLSTVANWATIGSFAVDVLSLGLLTINKHEKIRDPLQEARRLLDDAIDRIAEYSVHLNDEEFDTSMEEYDKARETVQIACRDRSSFDTFIVRAKKYGQNRNQAHTAKLKCQEALDLVKNTSVRAKRRSDVDERMINQHAMEERRGRLIEAGFQLANSSNNLTAMRDSEPDNTQTLAPTPSPVICKQLNNPFQSSDSKEINNRWKSVTTSSMSLETFVSE